MKMKVKMKMKMKSRRHRGLCPPLSPQPTASSFATGGAQPL